jgi:phosphonatase-like hydrolase
MVLGMKSQPYQLVVIDLMCTLVDSEHVTTRLLADTLAATGIDTTEGELRAVLGLPLHRAIAALVHTGASLEVDAARADRTHRRLVDALRAHYSRLGSVRELEGVTEAFATLRAQGLRIAVATVMPHAVADTILASLDWFDRGLIDTVVGCEDVHAPRPQPGMIFEAMRRTGIVDAKRVVKVGATPADLAEGTLAGCGAVVGLTCGMHSRDELWLRPHTHLVDRIASLLDVLALAEVCPSEHDRARTPSPATYSRSTSTRTSA